MENKTAKRRRLEDVDSNLEDTDGGYPAASPPATVCLVLAPEQIISFILPYLNRYDEKIRLSLTCKALLQVIPTKICSFDVNKISKHLQEAVTPPVLSGILARLPHVTSLIIDTGSKPKWKIYVHYMKELSLHLKELVLRPIDEKMNTAMIKELLSPDGDFPVLPNLEKFQFEACERPRGNLSFHRFPHLQELTLVALFSPKSLAESIVKHCPLLKNLRWEYAYEPIADLESLKRLENLESIWLRFASSEKAENQFSSAWRALDSRALTSVGQYLQLMKQHSPVGLKLEIEDFSLVYLAIQRKDVALLTEVVRVFREAANLSLGDLFQSRSPHKLIQFPDGMEKIDILRVLLENELDLGTIFPQDPDVFPRTLLDHITQRAPTLDVFKLIFETKLVNDHSMTAFEFARSLHPTYPFFWETPLFSMVTEASSRKPEALELMKYLVVNQALLLPMLGSELALGGPTTRSIHGKLPVHLLGEKEVFLFLVEQGADPWALDWEGNTVLSSFTSRRSLSEACVDYLLSLPSFDPKFINPNGFSHLDLMLRRYEPCSSLLTALINIGAIATDKTAQILKDEVCQIHLRACKSDELLSLLKRLKRDEIPDVLLAWFNDTSFSVDPLELAELVLKNLSDTIDIAILENELLKLEDRSLLKFCVQGTSTRALEILQSRVRESPLSEEIIKLWQPQLEEVIEKAPPECREVLLSVRVSTKPIKVVNPDEAITRRRMSICRLRM